MRFLLLLLPLFSFSQSMPASDMLDEFNHINDTAYISKDWQKHGFSPGNKFYGINEYYNTLGTSIDGGETIRKYMTITFNYAENGIDYNNRKMYYRTGSKEEFDGWDQELKDLGFQFDHNMDNGAVSGNFFKKGRITVSATVRYKDFNCFRLYKNNVYGMSLKYIDTLDIGYVLCFEVRPVLTTDELFELFAKRKDSTYIIKALLDHGFIEHKSDRQQIAVLAYLDTPTEYYSENFIIYKKPNDNIVCYITQVKESYDSWIRDLPAKGFIQLKTNATNTTVYRNGKTEVIMKQEQVQNGPTQYLLNIKTL